MATYSEDMVGIKFGYLTILIVAGGAAAGSSFGVFMADLLNNKLNKGETK